MRSRVDGPGGACGQQGPRGLCARRTVPASVLSASRPARPPAIHCGRPLHRFLFLYYANCRFDATDSICCRPHEYYAGDNLRTAGCSGTFRLPSRSPSYNPRSQVRIALLSPSTIDVNYGRWSRNTPEDKSFQPLPVALIFCCASKHLNTKQRV